MNTPKDNKRNEVLNTKSVRKFRAYCKAQYGSEPSFELCAKLMHNFYFVTASLAGEFWKCDEIADEYREGNPLHFAIGFQSLEEVETGAQRLN